VGGRTPTSPPVRTPFPLLGPLIEPARLTCARTVTCCASNRRTGPEQARTSLFRPLFINVKLRGPRGRFMKRLRRKASSFVKGPRTRSDEEEGAYDFPSHSALRGICQPMRTFNTEFIVGWLPNVEELGGSGTLPSSQCERSESPRTRNFQPMRIPDSEIIISWVFN